MRAGLAALLMHFSFDKIKFSRVFFTDTPEGAKGTLGGADGSFKT
jgi:hypothetical protein